MNLERQLMHYWVRIRLRSVKPEVSLNIKTIAGNIEELENISRLTENILFLAGADKNNVLVKLDSLSLNKEVENLLDYLEYLSDEKEICFKVECNQQIFADKILLQRMLSNLIVNAIRYSPEKSRIHITSFLDTNSYLNIDIASHGRKLMSLKNSSVDFGGEIIRVIP